MARRKGLDRPPSFPSRATLAAELEVSEDRIDRLVESGILPRPLSLDKRLQRWDWEQVRSALSSKAGGAALTEDPYDAGVRNVAAAQ